MEQAILKTEPRNDTPKNVRAAGWIPGVLHGPGATSVTVQFDKSELLKILAKHGTNAKVWIMLKKQKEFGIVKEVQKDPLDKSVLHVTVLIIPKDQEVKMQVQILFHGKEELEARILHIQVFKGEIELQGKAQSMPESITANVAGRANGDHILLKDLEIPKGFKVLDEENEIYGVIKETRTIGAETPEATDASETPAATPAAE